MIFTPVITISDEEIDEEVLLTLQPEDINNIVPTIGGRRKLNTALEKLRAEKKLQQQPPPDNDGKVANNGIPTKETYAANEHSNDVTDETDDRPHDTTFTNSQARWDLFKYEIEARKLEKSESKRCGTCIQLLVFEEKGSHTVKVKCMLCDFNIKAGEIKRGLQPVRSHFISKGHIQAVKLKLQKVMPTSADATEVTFKQIEAEYPSQFLRKGKVAMCRDCTCTLIELDSSHGSPLVRAKEHVESDRHMKKAAKNQAGSSRVLDAFLQRKQ